MLLPNQAMRYQLLNWWIAVYVLREKNMANILKTGGKQNSDTPSIALLNQKLGTLKEPRMLTPSELALLRQSKTEIAACYRATHH